MPTTKRILSVILALCMFCTMLPETALADSKAGDINMDGMVNNKDLTRLAQYLAGRNVAVDAGALDVNGDGSVNNKDLTRLAQFLAGRNVTIYPIADEGTYYTVTFDANGSDVENLPAPQRVKEGEKAAEPAAPTRAIYAFTGWYTDSECKNGYDFTKPVKKDLTLYAGWECEIYAKALDEAHIKTGMLEFEGEEYEGEYIDNELILVVKDDVSREQVEQLVAPYGGKVVGQISSIGYYQIELDGINSDRELERITDSLLNKEEALEIYPNQVVSNTFHFSKEYPNDYDEQVDIYESEEDFWDNDKSYIHHLRACNVPYAWSLVRSVNPNPTIRMGLIDDTVDGNHEDLNVINAFYYKDRYNPFQLKDTAPEFYHGTHVAGIMGAGYNNGKGIAGVCIGVELIAVALRANDDSYAVGTYSTPSIFHTQSLFGILDDYSKLIESNCKIINVSMGCDSTQGAKSEKAAKKEAKQIEKVICKYIDKNYKFLFVTSAGNDGNNPNHNVNYAGGLKYIQNAKAKDRIIVVGNAVTDGGTIHRSTDSSYIGGRVDVMAPGHFIYSTIPNNEYDVHNGTSMASPFVAGVAGLIWRQTRN